MYYYVQRCIASSNNSNLDTKSHLSTEIVLSGKSREFFARKLTEMKKQFVEFPSFLDTPVKAQLASFKVAYRIAKCKKPDTIAEELVLPAALDLVSTMIGESVAQKLKVVPLLNNTICRRIEKISDDINPLTVITGLGDSVEKKTRITFWFVDVESRCS